MPERATGNLERVRIPLIVTGGMDELVTARLELEGFGCLGRFFSFSKILVRIGRVGQISIGADRLCNEGVRSYLVGRSRLMPDQPEGRRTAKGWS